MKITSGSAAGAGASRDSTTGTGAAGAAADGRGKAGSSRSAIANAVGDGSTRRNVNITLPNSVEVAREQLKPRYLKRGPQGIMPGSMQAWEDGI